MQHKSSRAFCWLGCLLTYSLLWSRPRKGPVSWYRNKMWPSVTNGRFSRTARLRTRPVTQRSTWRKRISISSNLACGPKQPRS